MALDAGDRTHLLRLIADLARDVPEQHAVADRFSAFVHAHPHCCERSLPMGHLTGSAWLVDRSCERVLLTHHRKLDRWLQLGGHVDGEVDIARAALREAKEESGIEGLVVEPAIFDLDRHWIPPRATEPGHWHYDVRFVVRCVGSEVFVVSDESHALAWHPITALADDPAQDESVRRMARRWLGAASR
jgi:8-oxo-dGTP pyrophosphatase MutT (NUDIX family)